MKTFRRKAKKGERIVIQTDKWVNEGFNRGDCAHVAVEERNSIAFSKGVNLYYLRHGEYLVILNK